MSKKLILISTIVVSLFTVSCGNSQNKTPESAVANTEVIVNVDAKTFGELSRSQPGTVLDVRTPEEWAEGTLKDAVKINYQGDNFESEIESLDKNAPVYVYCKRGGRSSSAAEILKEKGFTKIYNLDGGITSWQENGFEVVK
ncbi:MAG: rhodanese-like domain-containing protein [Flavobacteriales bacterium]